jgi:hypothetical protein
MKEAQPDLDSPRGPWFDILAVVAAPIILAIVEIFHPHPHALLQLDVQTWLKVHYAQVLLFPLSALAFIQVVRGQRGIAATLCRVAMFLFAITYIAFDTAAGLVTGILVNAAYSSGAPNAWQAPIDAVWKHPIVGGSPLGSPPFFALFGSVALSVGAVSAAVALKRIGRSWAPVILFAISSFGIAIFKTHAWPGGPLTFGGMAVAGGWLEYERLRSGRE